MKHFKDGGSPLGKTGLRVDIKGDPSDPKNMEQAIKTLKRKTMQEGMIKDMRRIEYYEKGSERRRREFSEAVKRASKKQKQIIDALNGIKEEKKEKRPGLNVPRK